MAGIARKWLRFDGDALPTQIRRAQDDDIIRFAGLTLSSVFDRFVLGARKGKARGIESLMRRERLRLQSRFGRIPTRGYGNTPVQQFLVGDGFAAVVHGRSSVSFQSVRRSTSRGPSNRWYSMVPSSQR